MWNNMLVAKVDIYIFSVYVHLFLSKVKWDILDLFIKNRHCFLQANKLADINLFNYAIYPLGFGMIDKIGKLDFLIAGHQYSVTMGPGPKLN